MDMTETRPLVTGPGRALAVEIAEYPAHAYDVTLGALDRLNTIDLLASDLGANEGETLRVAYLRGLAAAAIVADSALGERRYTSAQDFPVDGGRETVFLREGVTAGMLIAAGTAMSQANWALATLCKGEPVPEAHRELADALRTTLIEAARARVAGVGRG